MTAPAIPRRPPPKPRPSFLAVGGRARFRRAFRVKALGSLLLRPIEPADEPLMVAFHCGLSEDSIHTRYFEQISLESRTRHERLAGICQNSDETFALIIVREASPGVAAEILAIGRLGVTEVPAVADFALLVNDKMQGHGLGSILMKTLQQLARAAHYRRLTGEVLAGNHDMLGVCRHFGFTVEPHSEDGIVLISLEL